MSGSPSPGALPTFNVGPDVTAILIAANGGRFDLELGTRIHLQGRWHDVVVRPWFGPTQERFIPDGYPFEIDIDRHSPLNELLITEIVNGFWAGGYPNGTANGGILYIYVNEPNGTRTTYQATQVALRMDEFFNATQQSVLTARIHGFASLIYISTGAA